MSDSQTQNLSALEQSLNWIGDKALEISNKVELDYGTQRLINGMNVTENYKLIYEKLSSETGDNSWSVKISSGAGAVIQAYTGPTLNYTIDKLSKGLAEIYGEKAIADGIDFFIGGNSNGSLNAAYARVGEAAGNATASGLNKVLSWGEELIGIDIKNRDRNLLISTPTSASSTPSAVEISTSKSTNKTQININDKTGSLANNNEGDLLLKLLAKDINNGDLLTLGDKEYIKSSQNTELTLKNIDPKASLLNGDQSNNNNPDIKLDNGGYLLDKNAKASFSDGTVSKIDSILDMTQSAISTTSKFIFNQLSSFTTSYKDYLVANKEQMLGDLISRLILGQNMEEALKGVAEVWGANALLNNEIVSNELDQLLRGSINDSNVLNGTKAGIVYFLTTVLISEIRNDGMNGVEYTEAAVKAAAIAAISAYIPAPQVAVIVAVMDSAITAIEERDDLDSQGWQNLGIDTAAAVGATVAGIMIGAEIGAAVGSVVPGVGTVVVMVVGAIIGALLYMPLKNLFHSEFEAGQELYDAIEDTFIKFDFSSDNVQENATQAIKAIEDMARAYYIGLPKDFAINIYNLFGGHYGQTYKPGEYGDPSQIYKQLYQITSKADGTGLEIIGVGREGVTLKASQNGVDDIYGSAQSDVMVGNDQKNIIIGSAGNDNGTDNDMIEGKGGDDIILGKAGHDHIDGGDGNDVIDGGTGNDRIIAGAGNDQINSGNGDDEIYGRDACPSGQKESGGLFLASERVEAVLPTPARVVFKPDFNLAQKSNEVCLTRTGSDNYYFASNDNFTTASRKIFYPLLLPVSGRL